MQEEIEQRSVTLIINSSKLSGRILASAFSKLLRYSKGKLHDHKEAKPQGKQSVKKLIEQNQGVETAELADNEEVRKFERVAKKFGVDYAIRKGVSERGDPRYILFFKARDRKAIDQALAAYVSEWNQSGREDKPSLRKTLQELIAKLPGRTKEKDREITR